MTKTEFLALFDSYPDNSQVVIQGWDNLGEEWVTYDSLDVSYEQEKNRIIIT